MIIATAPVAAQDRTPYFRVPMGASPKSSTIEHTFAWLEQLGACSSSCGSGQRIASYQCQNVADYDLAGSGYGLPEPDESCSSIGPKPPSTSSSCTVYSGCGYDWVNPPVAQTPVSWNGRPAGRLGCGWVNLSFRPYCQRTGGGANVVLAASDHRFCSADRPDYDGVADGDPDALGYDRNVAQEASCGLADHEWMPASWGSWSSECSSTAVRTRAVACARKWSGVTEADGACDQASRPAASETAARYGSCSFVAVEPSDWSPWASGCSGDTTRTRRYRCLRSNNGGQIVPDDECTAHGVDLEETQRGSNYAACTNSWRTGDWSGSTSGCSAVASRSRAVWCGRDMDGTVVPDDRCDAGSRPSASETMGRYDACSYSLEDAGTGACQTDDQRPHYWRCRRSDGSEVDSATFCGRSNPTWERCTYGWSYSAVYGDWSACAGGSQSRSMTSCIRQNGVAVAASSCNEAGYQSTQYRSCVIPPAQWTSFAGSCRNVIDTVGINDQRDSLPDADAYKQSCAARGGTCFTNQMSEQHDYDGRPEGFSASYICGTDPVYDPDAVGSFANANSSGSVYTEVRR